MTEEKTIPSILLSIVIPVYNRENFIEECLDSIINQPVEKSLYEIICVDDGSKDNSLSILRKYEQKHSNIKVFSQENQGASSARNHGIDKATGKYVWFIDSDDYLYSNALIDVLKLLIEESPGILVLPESNNEKPSKNSILKGKNLDVSMFSWGNIGLRSLITKWNIKFDKSIVYGEDALFWSSVYVHCDDVIKISKNIYNYRFHDGNIMSSTYLSFDTINKRINDIIYLNTAFNEILKDKNLSRTKKKVLKKKRNAQTEFLLSGLLPYSNLEYKKVLKALKKEKLYPYSFRKNAFIKAFKIKGLKHKFSHFLVWLFPLEIFYKLYYKKSSKNRKNLG